MHTYIKKPPAAATTSGEGYCYPYKTNQPHYTENTRRCQQRRKRTIRWTLLITSLLVLVFGIAIADGSPSLGITLALIGSSGAVYMQRNVVALRRTSL